MSDLRIVTSNSFHTQEELARYFIYDAGTGKLYWKVNKNRARAGNEAGTIHSSGYLSVQLDSISYLVHRIIWCLVYGNFPDCLIDHEDLDGRNNRLLNLRLANGSNNCSNSPMRSDNTSGVKGVHWHKRNLQWEAKIQCNGIEQRWYFNSKDEATIFIKEKRTELHKQFANHGESS